MEFRLVYRGDLKSNRGKKEKQDLRRCFHPQLKLLWSQQPLVEQRLLLFEHVPEQGQLSLRREMGRFVFVPLVSPSIFLVAELDVLFLRPQEPGSLLKHGGDIDNRIKTLFDALRVPVDAGELPDGDQPAPDEIPFFCLLEDDGLITRVSVTTDRLLEPTTDASQAVLVIHVNVKPTRRAWANIGLV